MRFASELLEGSPFVPREARAGKDARTLVRELLAMAQGDDARRAQCHLQGLTDEAREVVERWHEWPPGAEATGTPQRHGGSWAGKLVPYRFCRQQLPVPSPSQRRSTPGKRIPNGGSGALPLPTASLNSIRA